MPNIKHDDYLKRQLETKKMELRELVIQHRIRIAEYNIEAKLLGKQIDSIERQLENNKGDQ